MRTVILAFLFFLSVNTSARQVRPPLFGDGDTVCFIGNSITNNGEFYNFIYLYYATRFPTTRLTFINCGISGDVAAGMLKRLDGDVFRHHPNWTVLMAGMNDVKRNLYTVPASDKPQAGRERHAALTAYSSNMDTLVRKLKAHGRVVLQTPTIYDQTARLKTENAFGVNDALDSCAEVVKHLSSKYQTILVNYRDILTKINRQLQGKDPSATIIGPDRIHPGSAGHLIMAYQFLKETGAVPLISRIAVNKEQAKATTAAYNCDITDLKNNSDSLVFTCLEHSLPFPVKEEAAGVLDLIPFARDLNQQILQVDGLNAGHYNILIDDRFIASCSSEQLKAGVDLATIATTPQYAQALRVMSLCTEYRKYESVLRSLKFVETGYLSDMPPTKDTVLLRDILNKKLKGLVNSGHYDYYRKQFENYFTNKSRETETEKKLVDLRNRIYRINQPVSHRFKLVRKN